MVDIMKLNHKHSWWLVAGNECCSLTGKESKSYAPPHSPDLNNGKFVLSLFFSFPQADSRIEKKEPSLNILIYTDLQLCAKW